MFARFTGVSGANTFSSNAQFNFGGTLNRKKRQKFATTSTTWSRLIRFAARWTNNLHGTNRASKLTGTNARRD